MLLNHSTEESPATPAALNRRASLSNLSRDTQRAIAFLDAEEKMLELRLSRRTDGDLESVQRIRSEFHQRRDAMVNAYIKVENPTTQPFMRKRFGAGRRGSRHAG